MHEAQEQTTSRLRNRRIDHVRLFASDHPHERRATIRRARHPTPPRIASINADGHISKVQRYPRPIPHPRAARPRKSHRRHPIRGWLTASCVTHHPNRDQPQQALLTSLPRAPRRSTEGSLLVRGRSTPSHPIQSGVEGKDVAS